MMMQFRVVLGMFLKLRLQDTRVNYNKDSLIQARNFNILQHKSLQHWCFPVINEKFSRTLILKNICERLLAANI